jgi:hypothetical protein
MMPLKAEKTTRGNRWSQRNPHRSFYLRLIGRLEKEGQQQAANAIRGTILMEYKP